MRQITLAIIATLALSGCESDHERMLKQMELQIRNTITIDWYKSNLPFDALSIAHRYCQDEPSIKECDRVTNQLEDISISYASCLADRRSTLCQGMVAAINQHPILAILPKSSALPLPDQPLYWSLPTTALDSQASKNGYRTEVTRWWWQSWHTSILSCIALLIMSIATWKWRCNFKIKKRLQAEYLARQRADQIEKEKQQRAYEKQIQLEKEIREKWLHDQTLIEQQRLAAENLIKQKSDDAAAKLAAEQSEAARVLSSIFAPTEKIQRRNLAADNQSASTSEKYEGVEHD